MIKPARVIFLDEAKEEFERLNKIAGWQKEKGIENSDEIRLLNSIKSLDTNNKKWQTSI